MKKINKKNHQSGQVLLLVVMLLATVLTISLTATLRSTSETQITKLEEENQKALAAAEAAIEKALQSKQQGQNLSFSAIGLPDLSGIDLSQSSVTISNQQGNTFITPLLQKDEQYTFYLTNYDPQNKTLGTTSTSQDVHICFGSSSSRPAIEITLIKTDRIKRYAVNPQSTTIIANGSSATSPSTNCPSDTTFMDRYSISSVDIGNNSQLLIVRVINGSTRIGFKANNSLPPQGSTITSTAKSTAGVVKKVQLFQSYPQIPADFFVTSF